MAVHATSSSKTPHVATSAALNLSAMVSDPARIVAAMSREEVLAVLNRIGGKG